MEKTKIDAFSKWIDTLQSRKEIEATLVRLERAKDGHDIAYSVVANMYGIKGIDSRTVLSELFVQTLIDLAPNLKKHPNVPSVSYHIRKMVRELEWDQKESRQKKEEQNDSAKTYILVVKKIMEWKKLEIEGYLKDGDVDYEIVKYSDFDGNVNSDETAIQFEGDMYVLTDILKMIESRFGKDAFDNITLTYVQDRISNDSLTMSQTLYLLQDEE